MSTATIHPVVSLTNDNSSFHVWGIDASQGTMWRDFENADCAEKAVKCVYEAIRNGWPVWDGRNWHRVNPAHVVTVYCPPFD